MYRSHGYFNTSPFIHFGGSYSNNARAGAFYSVMIRSDIGLYTDLSCRLMFL